jgi:S1-C subfamily serine protease
MGGFTTILALVGLSEDEPVVEDTQEAPVLSKIPYESVVQIWAMYYEDDELVVGWTGSGSIISPDGYILTNAHVVLPDKFFPVDALGIAMTVREDQPPQPTYYAEVLQADAALDIAVIRLTTDLDGNLLDFASLDLPFVPIGDSDGLRLGDPITIIGYPGIGGQTITLTSGEVSGFTSEEGRGDRAFIKTSATIAGGNSGGLAATPNGVIIGVPTQLGYGGEDQYVDCRVLADTNRDGYVDEYDNCVPTGGFINALRPINLAMPLIEAAQRGEVLVVSAVEAVEADFSGGGQILFQDDFSNSNSGWDVGSLDNGSVDYVNGEYQVEVFTDNYVIWGNAYQYYDDVVVSVDVRVIEETGVGEFGVICRYQDFDNFYFLEATEDGYFGIWKYQDDEFTALVDWTASDVIPTDGSAFTLTAACVGDTLSLAVNGVPLAEVNDANIPQGDVGLIAGTWDYGGLAVAFDNIVVRSPD